MRYIFMTACAICATYLKFHNIEGWWWFLVIAVLAFGG
ncbi:Hypothetical protein AJF4211_000190 [Avibacterium paragallinarum JF4211]|uniref:Uncharacterized protein n=1 Tax=Avibacterium paragallinarum TaxID=728 RepID=A0A377I8M0_AVIPA|nr:Hypothetical protein AJF4211_000130 [Avibacterium paragallinarum JF4211]CDF99254.1 Hypothetical protein AJF4211_000190 [Avibacterium paragallinarum JF4211]STO70972.1 Uncharacterised protein [Avibacterium paragallinarum]STO71095.1 Uncharacterised protein [Avibacterium paragallinarum]STO71380.1 Uncharacterised protein [Avibacterium paragallinarum]